jgi:hypothetical protein
MGDTPSMGGWWQASDGNWYPPEQHPDYRPPAPASGSPARSAPGHRPPPAPEDRLRTARLVWLACAGAWALGAFLPWFSITAPFFGSLDIKGVDWWAGWGFVGAAAVVGALAWRMATQPPSPQVPVLILALGIGGCLIAGYYLLKVFTDDDFRAGRSESTTTTSPDEFSFEFDEDDFPFLVRAGTGLYLAAAGSVGSVAGFVYLRRNPRRVT